MSEVDREAVRAFLYREARLADEWRLDEWLALWAEGDIRYWIPCNQDDIDPQRQLSIIYDDRARLEMRVRRVQSGLAWTQEPRSRLRRIMGNIEIFPGNDHLQVWANFQAAELRPNDPDPTLWIGRSEYHLVGPPGDLRMRRKKVLLLNNDQEMTQLSCLL